MKTYAVIVAGGKAARFGGDIPKQFLPLGKKPVLSWTVSKFQQAEAIDKIVIVVAEEYLLHTAQKIIDPYHFSKVDKIVIGGESRRESVLNGLEALPISCDYVAIHDAARPMVEIDDINRVIKAAIDNRAAILASKTSDTLKRVKDDYIIATIDRQNMYQAQTPQVFQFDLILQAHRNYEADKDGEITDDASLIEKNGFKVKIVEASRPNFKITTADDLRTAKLLMEDKGDE